MKRKFTLTLWCRCWGGKTSFDFANKPPTEWDIQHIQELCSMAWDCSKEDVAFLLEDKGEVG